MADHGPSCNSDLHTLALAVFISHSQTRTRICYLPLQGLTQLDGGPCLYVARLRTSTRISTLTNQTILTFDVRLRCLFMFVLASVSRINVLSCIIIITCEQNAVVLVR